MIAVLVLGYFAPITNAFGEVTNPDDEIEDGAIKQHELFEFEAFIKHGDVADGTEPFDRDDQPGNDSDPHNKIVRSWDTVTYPLKITVNPKKADVLENIVLKITGTLDNGIVDGRVNAKFAIGGTEDIPKEKVSFEQLYTIERTGNSIMIPVTIEVQGAKNDVKLTPDVKVEVVSVDGKPIKGIVTEFKDLPGVTTSAKVNIKPYIGAGLNGQGMPYLPYAAFTGNDEDIENTQAFSVSFGIDKLPGKTDMRGATFPDPDGKIHYKIEMEGHVAWDKQGMGEVPFDFTGQDSPYLLFDHQPINYNSQKVGQKNMLADGISYNYTYRHTYHAPISDLADLKKSTIDKESYRSVWGSGQWDVSAPEIGKNQIVYEGTNTGFIIGSTFPRYRSDGWTGNPIYGENDRLFTSHSFIVLMANEYRIGGPNNQDELANNAFYRSYVRLTGYEDEFGQMHAFDKRAGITFSERNNPSGSYSVQNTFKAYPSGVELGTPNIGWTTVSKGDASTLLGEDVFYEVTLGSSIVSYGGYKAAYRWNTDAFELTKAYAKDAENRLYGAGYYTPSLKHVANNKKTQKVYYGVPQFTDNAFKNFTSKGIDDYDWYETYDEAVKHGPVGAMQMDVSAPTGPKWQGGGKIPLRVKHENIGVAAETKNGTPNILVTNYYPFPKADRSVRVDVAKDRAYHNPAIWDNTGTMLKKQSPAGSTINFETLAIVPAETATTLTPNKTSFYNSETIQWTAKNSIVLPKSGVPDDLDAGVTITHTLPKGLNYKVGSGKVGNKKTEPEVIVRADGGTDLVWHLLVSNKTHTIDNIYFETTINPFAIQGTGVQASAMIKSVIESQLDQRPPNLRTTTASVTILKVGMVGIYESVNKSHGKKNSDFILTLSPYTTIEDEEGVTGLSHLPLSGDRYGSKYNGRAFIKDIQLVSQRVHNRESVDIYLNKSVVNNDKPHKIDVTKDGWYKYTGDPSQLDGALSLLFHVNGKMTSKDTIQINVHIQTADNEFGDQYLNETVINSDTDYRLSPISNRVRYMIRADLELGIERFQIYTNKASDGLPTSTRVAQTVLDPEIVKDQNVTLAIYDSETGEKVASKTYAQHELRSENAILIPPDTLKKADKRNYEVRIEGYDTDNVWVRDGEGAIDTDGHTAKEGTLTVDNADANGDINFKGVTMTERELGKDMVEFYESWIVKKIPEPTTKSGYSFEFKPTLSYTNDLMNEVKGRVADVNFAPDMRLFADHRLIDQSLEYYDRNAAYQNDDKVEIGFVKEETPAVGKIDSAYQLPPIYLEQGTGLTFSGNQKENGAMRGTPLEAGNKLYVPVWIDRYGIYDTFIRNKQPIGSHFMSVDLLRKVNVEAYMFNHVGSETSDKDELLIHPMEQDEIPDDL